MVKEELEVETGELAIGLTVAAILGAIVGAVAEKLNSKEKNEKLI